MGRGHSTARLELLDRDAALPTVLSSDDMEIIDQLLLLPFSKEEFWCLMKSDYGDAEDTKD
jgi:hypothetical protein